MEFKIGDKVRWFDPAHTEYRTPLGYAMQCERVMTVYDVREDMVCCSDEYGDVEADPDELMLVED